MHRADNWRSKPARTHIPNMDTWHNILHFAFFHKRVLPLPAEPAVRQHRLCAARHSPHRSLHGPYLPHQKVYGAYTYWATWFLSVFKIRQLLFSQILILKIFPPNKRNICFNKTCSNAIRIIEIYNRVHYITLN